MNSVLTVHCPRGRPPHRALVSSGVWEVRVGLLARGAGAVVCSVVVLTVADGPAHRAEREQHQADDEYDKLDALNPHPVSGSRPNRPSRKRSPVAPMAPAPTGTDPTGPRAGVLAVHQPGSGPRRLAPPHDAHPFLWSCCHAPSPHDEP